MKYFKILLLNSLLMAAFSYSLSAQQEITVEVSPNISKAIEGNLSLNRTKYFNLAASGTKIEGTIGDKQKTDYFFKDLGISLGRALGMVNSEVNWGNSIFEDPAREGYTDIPRMLDKLNPSNDGASAEFMELLGENQNVAFHDQHDSYPDFMEKYSYDGANDQFPVNNDAASELAAELLENKFTDWTRPAFYEPVNEPDWRFWGDDRFINFHTSIHDKVKAKGLNVEVGGPCLSVAYFYKDNFSALKQITGFIDKTNNQMDFYSFHIYDYMDWSDAKFDITGSVTSGLPVEGVLDAVANYTYNKYGKAFTYVTSEHGAYITDGDSKVHMEEVLSEKYFPGDDFENTMERRSISDHLSASSALANTFAFMNSPHIVKKSVPFILLESYNWNPRYYACLLVAENFNQKGIWHESDLLHFYQYFKDVKGRRVLSHCDDNDIQHHAFVDGSTLILLFNNVSNVKGTIDLNIDETDAAVQNMMVRRYGRRPDFRPFLKEERIFNTDEIAIAGREALAIFIEYEDDIKEEQILNEVVHYGNKTAVAFSGTEDFEIATPDFANAEYAILRIGIGMSKANPKEMNVSINGTELTVPVEDAVDRYNGGGEYGSSRSVKFDPALLQAVNTVSLSFPSNQTGGVGAVVIRAGYPSADTLTSFIFSPREINIYENQEYRTIISYFPETTNEKDLAWTSLDELIATVSSDGVITGQSKGSTKIVATNPDDLTADTVIVNVSKQELQSNAEKSGWKVAWLDNEATVSPQPGENAIDGDINTFWHTEWQEDPKPGLPHEIWIDMGQVTTFNQFIYTPRQDPWGPNGTIGEYELYFSDDTAAWGDPLVTGSFVWNVGEESYYKEVQVIDLPREVSARYFRFVALTEHQDDPLVPTTCVAELDVSVPLSGIAINIDTISISVYESAVLEVQSLPGLSTIANNQFYWYADEGSIVEVEDGVITGIGEGIAKVYVKTFDGLYIDSITVDVSIVPVSEITLSAEDITILVGETHILTAEILPANAYYNSYEWLTENESVASVDMGYVTGEDVGTTEIKVLSTDGSTFNTCTVNVIEEMNASPVSFKGEEMKLYPNPAQNLLNLELPEDGRIQIINVNGVVLAQKRLHKGYNKYESAEFESGMHFLRYITDEQVKVIPFMVTH